MRYHECEIYMVFDKRGAVVCMRLLDPHLARTVPWYTVIVLIQRFFLLDADRLRANRLGWFGEMFS